ncbi:LacI family transcriptional regulator [Alsobacter soli]|uniref:LacI family transcriptional regulator n=1 Tax=Alsobacter soli TaxID=2109933 RepID=A0A2T1HNK3_9HYPH|nr:LacI family DNA-binding transcriptional regulator [Alsobacter soli]PSC03212.1 LacI family transcriptional regulator [Alsobacter soli]
MDDRVLEGEEQAGARRRAAARIPDIARLAGASTATVDRVLNRRPGVRPATIQRVLKAAAALDYLPDEALVGAGLKPLRIVFVLPEGTNRFLSMLGRLIKGAQNQLAPMNVRCQVETIRSFHPELLAQSLREHGRRVDGVAFMALEHPAVREAVNALADQGKPTVTLISDIAHSRRVAYVGLDNRSVGRTAGYLMARLLGKGPAKVAMIAGSLSYRAHEEREMGFLHIFQEMFPQVAVVGLREGQDDEGKNYRQTRMLLAQHPDLAGIYNIGGGPEGVARALREARREQEVVFIGHGLTEETRALLIDGAMDAVITQNPQAAMMSCVNVFANLRAGRDPLHGVEPPRTEIFFRENLP